MLYCSSSSSLEISASLSKDYTACVGYDISMLFVVNVTSSGSACLSGKGFMGSLVNSVTDGPDAPKGLKGPNGKSKHVVVYLITDNWTSCPQKDTFKNSLNIYLQTKHKLAQTKIFFSSVKKTSNFMKEVENGQHFVKIVIFPLFPLLDKVKQIFARKIHVENSIFGKWVGKKRKSRFWPKYTLLCSWSNTGHVARSRLNTYLGHLRRVIYLALQTYSE